MNPFLEEDNPLDGFDSYQIPYLQPKDVHPHPPLCPLASREGKLCGPGRSEGELPIALNSVSLK